MYTYDDISNIEKKFNKFLIYFITATIIFLIVLFALCKNWGTALDPVRLPSWPGYAAGAIYAMGAVFSWGMFGSKLISYKKFVTSILTGLEKTVEGEITAVSSETTYDNNLEFYSIEMAQGKDVANRKLYIDAAKFTVGFNPGDVIKVKVFENYIKEVLS